MREVVLDTETTGLNHAEGHRVIEIGCIELLNHFPSGRVFHTFVNPERDVPKEAEAVHGISTESLLGKPVFADIVDDFLAFIEDSTLVIHNAGFDVEFLNAELARAGRPLIGMNRVVDTLLLARRKHPGAPNSLDALCKRYQIDISQRTKHGALLDSELTAKVYLELIGGHQARLDLSARAPVETRPGGSVRSPALARPQPLPARLTEAEIAAHRAFIESLGKEPLWLRHLDAD
jgi:DNA polymerase-3 subunit epsilon